MRVVSSLKTMKTMIVMMVRTRMKKPRIQRRISRNLKELNKKLRLHQNRQVKRKMMLSSRSKLIILSHLKKLQNKELKLKVKKKRRLRSRILMIWKLKISMSKKLLKRRWSVNQFRSTRLPQRMFWIESSVFSRLKMESNWIPPTVGITRNWFRCWSQNKATSGNTSD